MSPKRKRRCSPTPRGLAPGEHLKRTKLAGNESSAWGWVDIEVSDPAQITPEHYLMTCGLSQRNKNSFCGNNYAQRPPQTNHAPVGQQPSSEVATGELENDLIVISDEEPSRCTKKTCKNNPNCLNHLGQEQWEDEDRAREQFMKASDLGFSPLLNGRDPGLPVGLKNLGATCYANAFLQVWFRDLAFRNGVYQCRPIQDDKKKFEDSPIFQLQVTFAALQESKQRVYDPGKLAESLKLSTSEQQDAQEFSKLFMSHLDMEFQAQSAPSLKTLVSTQFQGQQVYGTICSNCGNKSERSNGFLELEISIEVNSRLEDRIAMLLQDEKLSGDNKYHCSSCGDLQDATRYTELRALPPVLHFSLLRFVYDFTSMERKKSKHNLIFPTTLDMGQFLGRRSANVATNTPEDNDGHMYELRGVLLHKGASAYHGHYEAQVFDTASKSWFQFDDETVTKIDLLGEKRYSGQDIADILNGNKNSQSRGRPTKRRRIEDSDDERADRSGSPHPRVKASNEGDIFSSKDAYMLIYARKAKPSVSNIPNLEGTTVLDPQTNAIETTQENALTGPADPPPPERARYVVRALNAAHDGACEQFLSRENKFNMQFLESREWMRSVYIHWGTESIHEDAVIISRQTLEEWVLKPLTKTRNQKVNGESSANDISEVVPVSGILCDHGALDPHKAHNMKRMSKKAYEKLIARDGSDTYTVRSPSEVCETCVRACFIERLYQIQHPRMVAEFDRVCDIRTDEPGFWLSKAWLKDWRLHKPRMHVPLHGDVAPDATEFRRHVRCEHDRLSLVLTARRSISREARDILMDLFPQWQPLSTNEEPCSTCEAAINSSREDKREMRRKAEEEKARLRHMHDNALEGNTLLLENIPCVVIPAQFVRIWRKWLSRPTDFPRPDAIDTSSLFCEHGQLAFDPNASSDWDSNVVLAQMNDWAILEGLYRCGPAVPVEKKTVEGPVGIFDTKFVHPIPVCHDCRIRRRSDYELTDITVRLVTGSANGDQSAVVSHQPGGENPRYEMGRTIYRYTGMRQSKRIRQGRGRREIAKLTVSKSTTVKDMKITVEGILKIPTICQKLFYKNQELEDNTATAESLGVLMNDVLDLREEGEVDGSDDGTWRKRAEKGFRGTLLATTACQANLSCDAGTSSEGEPSHEAVKACPSCTYNNPSDALLCGMCEAQLYQ